MALCQTTLQVPRRETIVRFLRQFLDCVVRAAMQAIAVHYGKLYLHLVHFRACCSVLSSAIDLITLANKKILAYKVRAVLGYIGALSLKMTLFFSDWL